MLNVGLQVISQGTVFMVKVHDEEVKRGRREVIGVSHRPTDLAKQKNMRRRVMIAYDNANCQSFG